MNTPNPTPLPPDPLTPEERELAARLGRLGPRGTPSPELDAKIIGAAHAAGRLRQPRQRRWPALLGLAATLALAIGVTWQMQPGGEAASRDEAPLAVAIPTSADSAQSTAAPALNRTPELAEDGGQSRQAAPMRMRDPGAVGADQPRAAVPGRSNASAIPAPPPLPIPQPTPPAAPPAAPVAERAIDASTPAQAQRETLTGRMPESRTALGPPPAQMDRATPAASAAVAGGDPAAVPVASDAELDPADWIERIRLRRDAGDLAGARESLQLLRRAHPRMILPADLRSLTDSNVDQP